LFTGGSATAEFIPYVDTLIPDFELDLAPRLEIFKFAPPRKIVDFGKYLDLYKTGPKTFSYSSKGTLSLTGKAYIINLGFDFAQDDDDILMALTDTKNPAIAYSYYDRKLLEILNDDDDILNII